MKIERSIEIEAPVEAVWQAAHEPAQRTKWDVRVAEYKADGPVEAGTPLSITWRTPVLGSVAAGRFVEVQAPVLASMEVDGSTLPIYPPGTVTWKLEPTKRGTRFTSRFEALDEDCVGPRPLIGFLIKRDLSRSLKNLSRLVAETAAVPGSPAAERVAVTG